MNPKRARAQLRGNLTHITARRRLSRREWREVLKPVPNQGVARPRLDVLLVNRSIHKMLEVTRHGGARSKYPSVEAAAAANFTPSSDGVSD